MPPAAIASRVCVTIGSASSSPRRCMRRRNSSVEACGNFGAPPQPPQSRSNCRSSARVASPSMLSVSGSVEGASSAEWRTASTIAEAWRETSPRRSRYASETAVSTCWKLGQPVPRLRRVVRAAEERLTLGREKDGHRPAAVPRERDDRVHVQRVDVGPLLAVDLDADEALVHQRRRRLVLERLVLHDVAPVAGRVADGEQDRLVLRARLREGLVAPRVPVDRVVRVLEEVRARFGARRLAIRPTIIAVCELPSCLRP